MNYFKSIKKIAAIAAIILCLPWSVGAVNDVQISDLVNFELQTADTAVLVTITADGGGQATNFFVESNYIDITLDNASNVTFRTNNTSRFFKVTKVSGSDDYTIDPSCPTNVVTMTGTGAQVILRLQVKMTDSCIVTPPVTPPVVTSGGGGGGGGFIPQVVVSGQIKINNGATETSVSNVILNISATNATQMAISNDPSFTATNWETLATSKPWTLLPGLGNRTVYAKFRNGNGVQSSIVSAVIAVKNALVIEPVEQESCSVDCSKLTYDLYIINPDGSERHMDQVRWAKKTTLPDGTLIVSFEDKGLDNNYSDVIVQLNTKNCSNITVSVLPSTARWSHQIKLKIFYQGVLKDDTVIWADSHLAQANPAVINMNDNGKICAAQEPVKIEIPMPVEPAVCSVDCSQLIYDLYIINPDGSERHMDQARWAKKTNLPDGSLVVNFEDKGLDNNYSDVIVQINTKNCSKITASAFPSSARWHHQIKLKVYARNILKDNITLWSDSSLAPISPITFNLNDNQNFCTGDAAVTVIEPVLPMPVETASSTVIKSECRSNTVFTRFLNIGSNDLDVLPLQKLLQCWGYIPASTVLTGHFGPATAAGVRKFQTISGIEALGYVGPATRAALNKYFMLQ